MGVLGAIGAGIGGLGLFTFVGGAITLARFRGAGISATAALAHVPKQDLFVVGVDALLLPVLVSPLLTVLVVFVADTTSGSKASAWLLVGLGVFGISYLVLRLYHWPGDWVRDSSARLAFPVPVVIAVCGGLAVWALIRRAKEVVEDKHPRQARTGSRLKQAKDLTRKANPARKGPGSLVPAGALFFIVATLFVAGGNYALGFVHPIVRPAALARNDGKPAMTGIFIGESDDRVWIAKVHPQKNNHDLGKKASHLIAIPKSKVGDLLASRALRKAERCDGS